MLVEIYLYVRFFTICAAICQSQGDVFLVSLALAARHRKCKRFFFSVCRPQIVVMVPGVPSGSQRGRRLKGKGKGVRAREHARRRREEGNACKEAIVFVILPTNLKNIYKDNATVND